MWPVSPAFLDAVTRSHEAVVTAEVHDVSTDTVVPLGVTDGSVVIDRTADVNRTCRLTLVDETGTLTVHDAEDLLAPFGNELRVSRGVRYLDGTTEEVPLGVFRITDWEASESADGLVVAVSGSDRSLVVQRAIWEDPYVIPSGVAVETALTDLLVDRFPAVSVNLPSMGAETRKVVLDGADGDPWRDARTIAQGAGWELKFDGSGTVVAVKPSTPESEPSVTYLEGEQGVLLDLRRGVSTAANVYNAVLATAENTGLTTPLRSLVIDDDPSSPTYYHGPFGKVPRRWFSPLATTQTQLDESARTLLDGILGANEDIDFRQIVNPALDDNDVVLMSRAPTGLEDVTVVLDVIEIPLTAAGAMRCSGRRRFL